MKKTYIAPQLHVYELGPESSMMTTISGGQQTSGFGTTTKSADTQSAGWQVDWDAADAEEEED